MIQHYHKCSFSFSFSSISVIPMDAIPSVQNYKRTLFLQFKLLLTIGITVHEFSDKKVVQLDLYFNVHLCDQDFGLSKSVI